MANISIDQLADEITKTLNDYHENVKTKVDEASQQAMKTLVQETRKNAPVGKRGSFKKSIASKKVENKIGASSYIWYVKAPNHRLTHLLVHGHQKKNGGRTKANPFLKNALENTLPKFEKAVEEAIKNDK